MHELLLFARTAAFTIANVQLPFHITQKPKKEAFSKKDITATTVEISTVVAVFTNTFCPINL
jgi:hypothetical protein